MRVYAFLDRVFNGSYRAKFAAVLAVALAVPVFVGFLVPEGTPLNSG